MSNLVPVCVNILNVRSSLKKLNLHDNLSKIREILSCDTKLTFLKNIDGSPIEVEDERNFLLKEILTTDAWNNQSIYLRKQIYWDTLNENHKLDYGRIMSDEGTKTADKRAFKLKDFDELKEIDRHGKGTVEINSNEELIKNKNLLFNIDVSINNLAKLGLSREVVQKKTFRDGTKLVYNYTEVGKATLKLSRDNLEPTEDFIKAVKVAIKSKDIKKITKNYGLFIPTEIIMGGRFYTNETIITSENSTENNQNTDINVGVNVDGLSLICQQKAAVGITNDNSIFRRVNNTIILGGKCDGVFDEDAWTGSLKDYQNWDCIEFNNPISIFQLIPYDLRKEFFMAIGKKILFTGILNCEYYLSRPGNHRKFELMRSNNDIPQNIFNIIQNEDADCDFFATAVDINENSKNVFFTCQVLKQKAEDGESMKPSIIIHAIQKDFRPSTYKLNIVLMIVGYDIDFNFIADQHVEVIKKWYNPRNRMFDKIKLRAKSELNGTNLPFFGTSILSNLEESNDSLVIGHNFHDTQSDHELKIDIFSYCSRYNRYVNLPNFTFCALIILDPHVFNSLRFKFRILKKPFINLNSQPKYVSFLHVPNIDHQPIFLKQKFKRITIEYVRCNCGKSDCICRKKTRKISGNESRTYVIFNL
ncbi:hypothetical protein RclHR1_04770003 [Rhizophagus clarus]|uniref:Uncharacterized protein n=1 Tax=Rhizophagus clarus TaxID=94130 RepID=A0A2Z6RWG1_9GLOM|nr:hypothetical protein RclHR1_04770003 [Rhizophagus clarus]GES72678.1 hypothetical protein GLOIN_2v1815663 [Rhizophagus clarus]